MTAVGRVSTGQASPRSSAQAASSQPALDNPFAAAALAVPQLPPRTANDAPPPPAASQPGATPAPAVSSAGQTVAKVRDPYPPLQMTPHDGAAVVDPRPIAPRSPRAALQPESVPLPTRARPSRRVRNPIVIAGNALLTIVFLLIVFAGVGFVVGKQRFDEPGPLAEEKIINIPRGGIRDIADLLQREGVIDQPYLFIVGAMLIKARNELKYGEYRFRKHASLQDVMDTMVEGKVVQHAVTFAEGLTSDQIVQRLMDNDVLTGNVREIPREGTLLPETYHFTRGTTREQIIKRMQQSQQRAVRQIWERRASDLPVQTPEQLVVLASIVEKETGKPEERTRVAAVFVNRLRQKMKLQSDPTIIYGLVGGKGSLGRPIMRREIEQPTPYNTYVIDGLPPGPIDNPGLASLEAAARPARTKELYFVADGTGGHAFAESYEQHQKNVAHLRALERGANSPSEANSTPASKRVKRGR